MTVPPTTALTWADSVVTAHLAHAGAGRLDRRRRQRKAEDSRLLADAMSKTRPHNPVLGGRELRPAIAPGAAVVPKQTPDRKFPGRRKFPTNEWQKTREHDELDDLWARGKVAVLTGPRERALWVEASVRPPLVPADPRNRKSDVENRPPSGCLGVESNLLPA